MPTWVSLLRAVNLGSRNKVPMPAFRKALEAAGFDDVATYVQSGNVVARSGHRSAAAVSTAIHDIVASEFGVDVPVVVRSPTRLRAAIEANPFADEAAERPKLVHVVFLEAKPSAAGVARLMSEAAAADACRVVGSELYVDFLDGVHGSRLTPDFLARRLGVAGTARNWRTVLAIAELAGVGG